MKNIVFCLLLSLSFLVFFACGSAPPASDSPPPPQPAAASAPTPSPTPQETPRAAATPSRTTDLILDGAETYTVVRGDTLTKIARRKYQNGFYYPLIMMASKDVIKDQDFIKPGMVLTIPGLQANLNDPRARESIKKFILETANITERKRRNDAAGLRKLANSL